MYVYGYNRPNETIGSKNRWIQPKCRPNSNFCCSCIKHGIHHFAHHDLQNHIQATQQYTFSTFPSWAFPSALLPSIIFCFSTRSLCLSFRIFSKWRRTPGKKRISLHIYFSCFLCVGEVSCRILLLFWRYYIIFERSARRLPKLLQSWDDDDVSFSKIYSQFVSDDSIVNPIYADTPNSGLNFPGFAMYHTRP